MLYPHLPRTSAISRSKTQSIIEHIFSLFPSSRLIPPTHLLLILILNPPQHNIVLSVSASHDLARESQAVRDGDAVLGYSILFARCTWHQGLGYYVRWRWYIYKREGRVQWRLSRMINVCLCFLVGCGMRLSIGRDDGIEDPMSHLLKGLPLMISAHFVNG